MEVSNTTNQDAKYKIAGGGGSPVAPNGKPFRVEEAEGWPTLPPGAQVQHRPKDSGPWVVYFVVRGEGIVKRINSDSDRVTLVESGGKFRVDLN